MKEDSNKRDGMNIPMEYFDQLQQSLLIQSKIEAKESLLLPDDYFESMQSSVLTQIPSNKRMRHLIPLSIAASILLLACFMLLFPSITAEDSMIVEDDSEMIDYLIENSEFYDIEDIAEFIDMEDTTIEYEYELIEYIDQEDFYIDDLIDLI